MSDTPITDYIKSGKHAARLDRRTAKEPTKMTAQYALVPVVATEEMLAETDRIALADARAIHSSPDYPAAYTAMLAAAPKELPDEVVDKMAEAYEEHYACAGLTIESADAHRAGIRAALLAVMGG